MKPLIGILAHPTFWERNHSIQHTCGENYLYSVEKAGGIPLILPIYDDPEAVERYADMCDGYIVPGGIDVNPLTYGEPPHPLTAMSRLDYDQFELHMIKALLERKKPVLGICRGIQIINVAFGGTLYQDVSLHPGETYKHMQAETMPGGVSHKVLIDNPSILGSLYGDELYTNSFHHQALKDIGKGLKVTAKAEDGIVEAVEAEDHPFLLAVQWHPEVFIKCEDNPMLRIFEKLIEVSQK